MSKRKLKIYWIYCLLLSFAYERPLVFLTSMDRVNPRLFDAILIIGLFFFWKDLFKRNTLPIPIRTWKWLVLWFSFCAIIWSTFFLPISIGKFSLFFAYRYLFGLAALFIISNIKFTSIEKRRMHQMIIMGGVFVAIYSLNQFFNPVKEIELAPGKTFKNFFNLLTGPFGATYFHIAQFSGLTFIFAFVYALSEKRLFKRILLIILSLFISFPLFFCGSRTALAYFLGGFLTIIFLKRKMISRFFIPSLLILAIPFILGLNPQKYINKDTSVTFSRIGNISSGENSFENRVGLWSMNISGYTHNGLTMPFIGAGFYVAPINGKYRLAYGIHNIYLFIIEQGGVLAFILFIIFLFRCLKHLLIYSKYSDPEDRTFAYAMLVYLICTVLIGIAGQIFWRGFNTNNMNSFILVCLTISLKCNIPNLIRIKPHIN